MVPDRSAAGLLRAVGLMADGPAVWDRALPPTGAGVFIVELASPLATAPLELTRVGKWLERVPDLRLDGERPTSRALSARLGSFWLASQPVLYVGSSETSIGRRVAAIGATVLGDRRPTSAGHWLHALALPAGVRVWWASTSAGEEYEDAVLAAFAGGVSEDEQASLPDADVVLPFANLSRPTGERRKTGLTGSLIAEPVAPVLPPTHVVVLPDGDAEGARGEPPEPKRRAAAGRAGAMSAPRPTKDARPTPEAASLTADGADRLRVELEELIRVRRPEVIGRIRAAKELGDLKENADYTAAREEQSFLEGRIQAIEARLRTSVVVETPTDQARIGLGSTITVEEDGEERSITIVGSGESDPTAGRISSASPVGRALLGHEAGDEVVVSTPAGAQRYRVVAIG